ncbi:MAG: hypothetical protein ACU0CA_15215 [Paracoccaceae bacterium]
MSYDANTKAKTPWHLWLIGIFSLLWHSGGGFATTMIQTRNAAYMSSLTPEQFYHFYNFPLWANIFWSLGVWAGVAGSIVLLLRSGLALWFYVLSFIGLVCTLIYAFVLSEISTLTIVGSGPAGFTLVIVLISFLLVLYARKMKMTGVLN